LQSAVSQDCILRGAGKSSLAKNCRRAADFKSACLPKPRRRQAIRQSATLRYVDGITDNFGMPWVKLVDGQQFSF
jgi:uncharacterized protein (UPF0147 family)